MVSTKRRAAAAAVTSFMLGAAVPLLLAAGSLPVSGASSAAAAMSEEWEAALFEVAEEEEKEEEEALVVMAAATTSRWDLENAVRTGISLPSSARMFVIWVVDSYWMTMSDVKDFFSFRSILKGIIATPIFAAHLMSRLPLLLSLERSVILTRRTSAAAASWRRRSAARSLSATARCSAPKSALT